jgi:hypothetical protein
MNTKSQVDIDRLRQQHMLDKTEVDKDMSGRFCNVFEYCKEKGDENSSSHEFLVEWNDINKAKSCVIFFKLSLSIPTPIISFVGSHNHLDHIPFCHLTQYCRSRTSVDIAWIHKVSACPESVPQGIKNAIELDKKSGNQLRKEFIEIELKQLTDDQDFIGLDSGKDISTGYQKIPHHLIFDVKYHRMHKERLVVGGNWKVKYREDIYSGVFYMDTVRNHFLREL